MSLLRVVLPWMIGKAFDKISKEEFIELLGDEVRLPVPEGDNALERGHRGRKFRSKGVKIVDGKVTLNEALHVAAPNAAAEDDYRRRVGQGVQESLRQQFSKYDLTGKTWAALTKSQTDGGGPAARRPSTPPTAAAACCSAGRCATRRWCRPTRSCSPSSWWWWSAGCSSPSGGSGTLKRLRAAPVTRSQILLGKFLPCLAAGRLARGLPAGGGKARLRHALGARLLAAGETGAVAAAGGADDAFAAMGLSLFVAAAVRTEMQVAIYGSVLVMVLGLAGGCLWPREQMPEEAKRLSLITPHAWALDAYKQLLVNPDPNTEMVVTSCLVLLGVRGGVPGAGVADAAAGIAAWQPDLFRVTLKAGTPVHPAGLTPCSIPKRRPTEGKRAARRYVPAAPACPRAAACARGRRRAGALVAAHALTTGDGRRRRGGRSGAGGREPRLRRRRDVCGVPCPALRGVPADATLHRLHAANRRGVAGVRTRSRLPPHARPEHVLRNDALGRRTSSRPPSRPRRKAGYTGRTPSGWSTARPARPTRCTSSGRATGFSTSPSPGCIPSSAGATPSIVPSARPPRAVWSATTPGSPTSPARPTSTAATTCSRASLATPPRAGPGARGASPRASGRRRPRHSSPGPPGPRAAAGSVHPVSRQRRARAARRFPTGPANRSKPSTASSQPGTPRTIRLPTRCSTCAGASVSRRAR